MGGRVLPTAHLPPKIPYRGIKLAPTATTRFATGDTRMDTRTLLENIAHQTQHLPDLTATIWGLSAIRYTPTTGSGNTEASPTASAHQRVHGIETLLDPLRELVYEWAGIRGELEPDPTRPGTMRPRDTRIAEQHPAIWLYTRLTWAENNHPGYAYSQQIISEVAARIANLTGYGPDKSRRHCPHCDTAIQRHPTDTGLPDLWTCPQCQRAWIITPTHDGLADTQREILSQQHILVTQAQAAHITGTTRQRIHNWIARGHLATHHGHVYLDHVTALAITHRV